MNVGQAVEAFFAEIAEHDDHAWQQVGRCVYCHDCGLRLYQGTMPKSHEKVYVPSPRTPKATQEMRARWGKD